MVYSLSKACHDGKIKLRGKSGFVSGAGCLFLFVFLYFFGEPEILVLIIIYIYFDLWLFDFI